MSRRRAVVMLAALLWMLAAPGSGQERPVDIRLKLTPEEVYSYEVDWTGRYDPGSRTERLLYREVVRVLEVEADGSALVEVARENFRNADGSFRDWADTYAPETFRIRPDGSIVERLSGRRLVELLFARGNILIVLSEVDIAPLQLPPFVEGYLSGLGVRVEEAYRTEPAWKRSMQDFPLPLPPPSVTLGETWSRSNAIVVHGLAMNATVSGTFERIEGTGDGRIARLRVRWEGRQRGRPFAGLPSGVFVDRIVTFRRVVEIAWAVERGRMVEATEEEIRDGQSFLTAQGQSGEAKVTTRESARFRLLPAESLAAAPVSPEFLIVPGKGIGTATLDLAVEELANRLGRPDTSSESLFRTPVAQWPNGLRGHVDAADQNRLVGLSIDDKRYRSAKGIGFGSSEGAVLITYGMSPTRVNMMVSNVGAVRVLIYNDQGIAFAMTSDEQHAGAKGRHAPVRAVDWVTVFPPGSAGKIYSLP